MFRVSGPAGVLTVTETCCTAPAWSSTWVVQSMAWAWVVPRAPLAVLTSTLKRSTVIFSKAPPLNVTPESCAVAAIHSRASPVPVALRKAIASDPFVIAKPRLAGPIEMPPFTVRRPKVVRFAGTVTPPTITPAWVCENENATFPLIKPPASVRFAVPLTATSWPVMSIVVPPTATWSLGFWPNVPLGSRSSWVVQSRACAAAPLALVPSAWLIWTLTSLAVRVKRLWSTPRRPAAPNEPSKASQLRVSVPLAGAGARSMAIAMLPFWTKTFGPLVEPSVMSASWTPKVRRLAPRSVSVALTLTDAVPWVRSNAPWMWRKGFAGFGKSSVIVPEIDSGVVGVSSTFTPPAKTSRCWLLAKTSVFQFRRMAVPDARLAWTATPPMLALTTGRVRETLRFELTMASQRRASVASVGAMVAMPTVALVAVPSPMVRPNEPMPTRS